MTTLLVLGWGMKTSANQETLGWLYHLRLFVLKYYLAIIISKQFRKVLYLPYNKTFIRVIVIIQRDTHTDMCL